MTKIQKAREIWKFCYLYLAIHAQPFHKCLTRISLPFVLKSSHPMMEKAGKFPEGQAGVGKGTHKNPHSLGDGKAERCLPDQLGQQRKQSTQRGRLFAFFVGLTAQIN